MQLRDIKFPKTFKDLTRDRLAMNAQARAQKRPQGPGDRGEAQGPDLDEHGQAAALSEAITFLQNYTGLNIVLDPKALADEGLTSASPVSLVVNQIQLKTALKLMLRPLGLTLQARGRRDLDHQSNARSRQETFPGPITSATW